MKWQLLGPLRLTDPPVALPMTPKANTVLSLLLCRRDSVVPVAALIDESWGARPPRTARTTLQTYILRLRKALANALSIPDATVTREVLVTHTDGYRIAVGPDDLDVAAFTTFARRGTTAHKAGNLRQAAELLDRALDLWKGPPLTDVPRGPALDAEVVRLRELRLAVDEHRIALQLDLGRSHETLGELAALTRLHPMNENLRGLFMVALHQAGRRSEALDAFRCLRERLVDELGIEPQATLRDLYQAMLSADLDTRAARLTAQFVPG